MLRSLWRQTIEPGSVFINTFLSDHVHDLFSSSAHAHMNKIIYVLVFVTLAPRIGELRTQKLKSHLVRTQSLNVLPLKPGVGLYLAIHATLTARDFFLAYFYPPGPFTCIFSKTSPDFSCVGCG